MVGVCALEGLLWGWVCFLWLFVAFWGYVVCFVEAAVDLVADF